MQISIDDNFLRAENQNIKLKVHAKQKTQM